MGTDKYEYSVLTIRILSVGYFFNILPGIVTPIVRGIGKPRYEMQACTFIAVANILLSTVLILKLGFVGALLGTSLSMSTGYVWYLLRFNKLIKESFSDFLNNILMKPVVGAGLGTITIVVVQNFFLVDIFSYQSSRVLHFISFGIQIIIFISVYIGILMISKHIDQTDILVLKNAVRALRREN
jgi:O-antigen/teichoic acid export membrane protein